MGERKRVIVAGGGAAGFFAAIACAEADRSAEVRLCEATAHPLAKVRVSGGGRCNVTHACFNPVELVRRYPRGSRELIGPFHRFGPAETLAWFQARGVELKTEGDGRMFPVSDDSATIVGCLQDEARRAGVRVETRCGLAACRPTPEPGRKRFALELSTGESLEADRLLLATGGTRGSAGFALAEALGHTIVAPVPSLFTFQIDDPMLRGLEGVAAPRAGARIGFAGVAGGGWAATGPILITHWGLSGPGILKLSAWAARELHGRGYRFDLLVNWAEPRTPVRAAVELAHERAAHPRRGVGTANPFGLPGRLWERLAAAAGLASDTAWAGISNDRIRTLAERVTASVFAVTGKSMNKEEFVTCGGVQLREVDFATMESRIRPGLHFAGELLDVDGLTGGFNFQAAWTTGWHAGRAMAAPLVGR